MAERELPPIRVRILADDSDFNKKIGKITKSLSGMGKVSADLRSAATAAKQIADSLNSIQMQALLTQSQQTRSVLKDLGNLRFVSLTRQIDSMLIKLRKVEAIYSKLQKGTMPGLSGGGGPSTAAVLIAAGASVAKSISDAIKSSAPHLSNSVQSMFKFLTAAVTQTGNVLTNSIRGMGSIIRTAFMSTMPAISSIFRSMSNAMVAGFRAAANVVRSSAMIMSSAFRTVASAIATITASLRAVGQIISAGIRASAQVVSQAIRSAGQLASQAIRSAGQVASQTIRSAGQIISSAIRAAGQVSSQAIRSAGQIISQVIRAAVQGYATTARTASQMFATFGRTVSSLGRSAATVISTGIRSAGQSASAAIRGASQMGSTAIREAGRIISTQIRANATASRTSRGGGFGGGIGGMGGGLGSGLTSRADIYMHANAMRALVSSGQGLLDMYGNLQMAEAGLTAFTKSAQVSASVMAEIKDHAEKTSFTRLGLTDATRNMMAYGLSARNALDHMKMLGDVAGGNELRFERLSYAMSQIISNSRLQGQELRQLTEQGFNPLETISRVTGKSMLELRDMMSEGAISADHVTEALKIETSAGGRFADMQKQMANTLPGVRNQLKETAQNLKMGFIKILESDLVNSMRMVIGYLKLFEQYLQTPAGKAMAIRMVEIAKNVFIAAVAFHAIGFAMASLMWWSQSVFSMLNRIVFVFRALAMGISLLVSIVTSPFALIVAGAIAAGLAVAYVASQIWGPNSVYDAFLNLYNTAMWFFGAVSGFLYNFGHNWTVVSNWLLDNWATIIPDMMDLTMRFFGAMINNAQVGFRTVARLMVVFTTWLVDTWYSLFDGRVYEAMVSGFIKIFTWLEDKWKAFANFMSKVWENLFDPGALYDVLNQGMGIDATAQAMTQDIQTTLDKGLFEGIKGVVESEYKNLSTGLEGFQASTPALTGLKFDIPSLPPIPKPPELPNAPSYSGKGFGDLGKSTNKEYKATEAMSALGSDYNKLLAEQSARMATTKANPQLAAQQQTNTLLGLIYNALKGAPQVNLQPAGVAGQGAVP